MSEEIKHNGCELCNNHVQKDEREPFMIPQNGMRFEHVLHAISMFDCIRVEYWKEVCVFFGRDILKDDQCNEKITSILKRLFWFNSTNKMMFDYKQDDEYDMNYIVEDNKTKYLRISCNREILWELEL